ncbi:MAG: hypothetical protein ACRET3_12660, partial [Burkholderiales bacterium]
MTRDYINHAPGRFGAPERALCYTALHYARKIYALSRIPTRIPAMLQKVKPAVQLKDMGLFRQ